MADKVKVDLHTLTNFSHDVSGLADSNLSQATGYGVDLSALAQMMTTETGMASVFRECTSFMGYHQVVATSAHQFLNDVIQGLASLGAGAEVCAINYASTDQLNAARQNMVHVDHSEKFAALDFALKGEAADKGNNGNDVFTPTKKDQLPGVGLPPASTKKSDGSPASPSGDTSTPPVTGPKDVVGVPEDPTAQKIIDGDPLTLGKGDGQITIPGDDPGGKLTPQIPLRPVTS